MSTPAVSSSAGEVTVANRTRRKIYRRLIPFLFLLYVIAFLDRANVAFAKLSMSADMGFSEAVFGLGAGIFYAGYILLEIPGALIVERWSARIWIARIMITWGIISSAFMFTGDIHWGPVSAWFNITDAEFTFYFLRFMLGVAEAGFFPGIILYLTYWFPGDRRAKMVALFMTAIAISNAFGSPISGAIMQYMDGYNGWRGWEWLFLLEGIPSVIMGVLVFVLLPNGPRHARWLTEQEKNLVVRKIEEDDRAKHALGQSHSFMDAFRDLRVWALALVYFCGVVCFYAVNFWMPTILYEMAGIAKTDFLKVGLWSMIPWGLAAVAMVLWGAHSDRTGERRWHASGGLLVAIVGMIILAIAGKSTLLVSLVALSLVTVGILSWVATFWSLPTAFLSGTGAAAGIAWINSVGNLGGHFGPDMIGRIRNATGGSSEAAFYTLAAVAFLGVLIILSLRKTQPGAASVGQARS